MWTYFIHRQRSTTHFQSLEMPTGYAKLVMPKTVLSSFKTWTNLQNSCNITIYTSNKNNIESKTVCRVFTFYKTVYKTSLPRLSGQQTPHWSHWHPVPANLIRAEAWCGHDFVIKRPVAFSYAVLLLSRTSTIQNTATWCLCRAAGDWDLSLTQQHKLISMIFVWQS